MSLNKFTIQKSFAISAGAGSGKTYTLSRRYINALLGFDFFREDYITQESYFENHKEKNARVGQIVTITYTEAAALEMKGRIFELISKVIDFESLDIEDDDYDSIKESIAHITQDRFVYVRETLQKAYEDSSNAKISTIHSYCLDIIKSNSDLARIDTKLDVIKEDEKLKELSSIIFKVLNDEKNKNTILDISEDISMFFLNNLISKYVSNTKFRQDYDSFDRNSIDEDEYKRVILELYPLPDVKEDFYAFKEYLEEKKVEDAQKYINFVNEYITRIFNFDPISWKDLSKEKDLTIAFNRKPWTQHKTIKENIDNIKQLEKSLEVFSPIDQTLENKFFNKIDDIKKLLHQIKNNYDLRLVELGKIDFDTIISKTLELIPYASTDFRYIMVDEFQDTNETQFEIVKKSTNENSNLFVVGDSKQSIYSFQGAEIEVFNNAISNNDIFSSVEPMSQNFRSDSVVLDNVNKIFKKLLNPSKDFKLISQNFEASHQDLWTKKEGGSFKFLITTEYYSEETELNELDTIATFISQIANYKNDKYKHISDLINKKQKAVAIVFDSSTKMLELKQKLKDKGITAKVSASDNFYHTNEVNDIFHVLKAIEILSNAKEEYSKKQKFYLVAAMRSNILKCSDNNIKKFIDTNSFPTELLSYVEMSKTLPLSLLVKYIYDDSNIFGTYMHLDNLEQRVSNLNKFLLLCNEYENSEKSNLHKFLTLLENSIYFSESKEDEAFYKSDNSKSIEICSIHSTKGLAYPLVLLANSEKGLYSQITSDALKHNSFTLRNQKKQIVGFKINDYVPLSHRALKQIDKLKHIAEKKRLLYVALTRAEHDIVISATTKEDKSSNINVREDSYLKMICDSLGVSILKLFTQEESLCIKLEDDIKTLNNKQIIPKYVDHSLEKIDFKSKEKVSATMANDDGTIINTDNDATRLGTLTHKIIENYWSNFKEKKDLILDKMFVFEEKDRQQIIKNMDNFYKSDVYNLLKSGVEHKFELEFNYQNKTGFIDFLYFDKENDGWVIVDFKTGTLSKEKEDKYQKQLDFYKNVLSDIGMSVIDKKILWV